MFSLERMSELIRSGAIQGEFSHALSPLGMPIPFGVSVLKEKEHSSRSALILSARETEEVPCFGGFSVEPRTFFVVNTKLRLFLPEGVGCAFTQAPEIGPSPLAYIGGRVCMNDPHSGTVLLPFYNVSSVVSLTITPGDLLGYLGFYDF